MDLKTFFTIIFFFVDVYKCCDFEDLFRKREVSIEDSISKSDIVFRGLADVSKSNDGKSSIFVANFDLINIYKGHAVLKEWSALRKISVTFLTRPLADCLIENEVPREFIIFANLIEDQIHAASVAKWDESADQRVWKALGWSKWGDWSSCSVSCSAGIQQRTRHCMRGKCPGFNIGQRHCNLFGCNETVTPLTLKEGKFFHPSRDRWQAIPDRPTAWRLTPNSYIWVPAARLFSDEKRQTFPKEFALLLTLRIENSTIGTIFSLRSRRRQDTYLSLEIAGSDLKLIHAGANGTDMVRIPVGLGDGKWHQVAISLRDGTVVDSYVDCEWSRTYILYTHSFDVPDDCDIIIGYLFTGDLEQLSIVTDPYSARLQCSSVQIPIVDEDVEYTRGGFKLFAKRANKMPGRTKTSK